MTVINTNQPVVIDAGSGVTKAGFAGQDAPTSVFPTVFGVPKHSRVMAGALVGDSFVGDAAMQHRGLLVLYS